MKDNFSTQAALYVKYRPSYPKELFEYILSFVADRQLAWDCATGNGQTAGELAEYFEKVYATDISSKQLKEAIKKNNIIYAVEPAENTTLLNASVNLITVSQALHWFNFDHFFNEVKRVSTPGGIIAVWMYNLLEIDPVTDKLIHVHHYETLDKYWDNERSYIDTGYASIPFPFRAIEVPQFSIKLQWSLVQLQGYLNTWSALQKFVTANEYNPVDALIEQISENWPWHEIRNIIFPIKLKMGYVY